MTISYSDIAGDTYAGFGPDDVLTFNLSLNATLFRIVQVGPDVEIRQGGTVTTLSSTDLALVTGSLDDGTLRLSFADGSVYLRADGSGAPLIGSGSGDAIDGADLSGAYEIAAGSGNDLIYIGTGLSGDDRIDGGDGFDRLIFEGVMADLIQFDAATVTGVERFEAAEGSQVRIALANETVGVQAIFDYTATAQVQSDLSHVDGSAVTSAQLRLTGGDGADTLIGGALDDTLRGNDGNDSLEGGEGADLIIGGAGRDTLTGGLGDDRFSFGFASPRSESSPNVADTITDFEGRGVAGGDIIELPAFAGSLPLVFNSESIDFAPDPDGAIGEQLPPELIGDGFADVSWRRDGTGHLIWVDADDDGQFSEEDILIRLSGVSAATDLSITAEDFASAFRVVRLTQGPDMYPETAGANTGQDEIYGLGGNDVISTGAQNDTVYGGGGDDRIFGGDGSDSLLGDDGDDYIEAGTGDRDTVRGGDGNDEIHGISGNEQVLQGDAGNDRIFGGTGTDRIAGGADNDELDGGDANDTIGGGSGDDLIRGGKGDDFLSGGTGNDVLEGGDGDDVLNVSAGLDVLTGGIGADQFWVSTFYTSTGTVITPNRVTDFDVASGDRIVIPSYPTGRPLAFRGAVLEAGFTGAVGDSLRGIDNDPLGSGFTQVFFWQNGVDAEMFIDLDGDRVLDSTDVRIIFEGLDAALIGEDAFVPGTFTVQIGSPGDDTLFGDSLANEIYGLGGADEITGNGGRDTLFGGTGNDTLIGGTGNDTLVGDEDDDLLIGGGGFDFLQGRSGNDRINGSGGQVYANGGSGDDILDGGDLADTLFGDTDNDLLRGHGGNDSLDGASGDDELHGGDGADILSPGAGDDVSFGGTGADRYRLSSGMDVFTGNGDADVIEGRVLDSSATSAQPQLQAFTTVTDFDPSGGDELYLTNGTGNGRAVRPFVFLGEIALDGTEPLAGAALPTNGLEPGFTPFFTWTTTAGTWLFADSNDNAVLDATDFTLFFEGSQGFGQEAFRAGTFAVIVGDGSANELTGTTLGDTIYGLAGDDRIFGLAGADSLLGGDGNDILQSGDGLDTVRGGEGDDHLFGGNDYDQLYGDAGADRLEGIGGSANLLFGGADNDTLIGADGNDNLNGDAGADSLLGGQGDDWLNGGADDDALYGEDGTDRLNGGAGSDLLDGGAGDDILTASTGADRMTGGTGRDVFYFSVTGAPISFLSEHTVILDFDRDEGDVIDLANNISSFRPPFVLRSEIAAGYTNTLGDTLGGDDLGTGFTQFFSWFDGTGTWLIGDTNDNRQLEATDFVLRLDGAHPQLDRFYFADDVFAVRVGTDLGDTLIGDGEADTIYGVGGNDSLLGLGGADSLYGGADRDTLEGGDLGDRLYGGAGEDSLLGGAGRDTIYGGDEADVISGGLDADALFGGGGNDEITGGFGDDALDGDAGDDVLRGGADNDQLRGGTGDDKLFGNDGADFLDGGSGNDMVDGGAGRDRVQASTGQDIYILCTGADIFQATIYGSGAAAQTSTLAEADIITDFRRSQGDELALTSGVGIPVWQLEFRGAVADGFTGIGSRFGGAALEANTLGLYTHTEWGEVTDPFARTWLIADSNGNGIADADDFALLFTGGLEEALQRSDFDGLVNVAPFARDDLIEIDASTARALENLRADWGQGIDFDPEGREPELVTLHYTDATGQEVSTAIGAAVTVTLESGAELRVEADGSFVYDPNGAFDTLASGETGEDIVRYTITDSDPDGAKTADATVTFRILPAGENIAPVFRDATLSIAENPVAGARLGTVSATDANDLNDLRYSIVDGNIGDAFDIDAVSGEVIVQNPSFLDHETNPVVFLEVEVRDRNGLGLSDTATLTVLIKDVNEAPVMLDQVLTLDENSAPGTELIIAPAADPDNRPPFDTLSYTILSGNDTSAFRIDSATGMLSVVDAAQLDFEQRPSIVLEIGVTDGGSPALSDQALVTVSLTDLNDEAPEADLNGSAAGRDLATTYLGGTQLLMPEMIVTDPDFGGTGTLSGATVRFSAPDGIGTERLSVDTAGTALALTYRSEGTTAILELTGEAGVSVYQQVLRTLSYENAAAAPTLGERSLDVSLSDGVNSGAPSLLSLTITVANAPPRIDTNLGGTLAEGGALLIDSSLLSGSDPDGPDGDLIYTITREAAHGALTVDGITLGLGDSFSQTVLATGLLSYAHDGSETVADSFAFALSDGEATLPEADFALSVTPVDDAPEVSVNTGLIATERGLSLIGPDALAAIDPDTDPEAVRFVLTSPPALGLVQRDGQILGTGDSFSMADISAGLVGYQGNDGSAPSVGFRFSLTDGTTVLAEEYFRIELAFGNAPPVIDPDGLSQLSGRVTELEDGAPGEGTDLLTVSGVVTVYDPEILDNPSAFVTAPADAIGTMEIIRHPNSILFGPDQSLTWVFSVSDAALDALSEGEELTQLYALTVVDGSGGVATSEIEITLEGRGDAVATPLDAVAETVLERADGAPDEGAAIATSGTIAFTDPDLADIHSVRIDPLDAGLGGILTAVIDSDTTGTGSGTLRWDYLIDGSALDSLNAGEVITQSFALTLLDPAGLDRTVTIAIDHVGANDAPELAPEIDLGAISEDATLALDLAEIFALGDRARDADAEDDAATLAYEVVGGPALGSLTQTADGLLFDPGTALQSLGSGESVEVALDVVARDARDAVSNVSTLRLRIDGVNDAPELSVNAPLALVEGGAAMIGSTILSVTDIDDAAEDILYRLAERPPYGELVLGGLTLQVGDSFTQADIDAGLVQYLHDGSDTLFDGLTLTFGDGEAPEQTLRLSINVTPVDDTPPVVDLDGPATSGIDRDLVYEGGALAVADTDAFILDPNGESLIARMEIRLSGDRDGSAESLSLNASGTPLTVTVSPDGAVIVTGLAEPQVYEALLATLTYRNEADSTTGGLRSVTVAVTDAAGLTSPAAVATIAVSQGNRPPEALDQSFDITEDTLLSGAFTLFTDPDAGDVVRITAVNGDPAAVGGAILGSGAVFLLSGDSSGTNLIYDPRQALNGLAEGETLTETVTFTVTDEAGLTDTGTITIDVAGVNDAPTALDDVTSVFEDGTTLELAETLLSNDSDPDGDTLSILSVDSSATVGTVIFDAATQSLRYRADADILDALEPGDSLVTGFDYVVTDAFGGTDTARVEITVYGVAEPNKGGNVNGGGTDDVLQGDTGANSLRGGAGNDTLIGGGGDDTLNGGAGADVFVFGPGSGRDEITGYEPGLDRIDAAAALGLTGAGAVFAFFDSTGDGRIDDLDRDAFVIRGRLTLEFDGDGIDGNAADAVTLKSISALTSADFGDAMF
ncbi:cadherin-like domain-containing protein [Litorisediminicola beolgyonensis]|uniref:Cadherin-like domain-containing protein n=1 Tax=Litorisediminicola beolgyonensis TaxID=1173614 RepID=A0ABW3ZLD9_9RHOB